MNSRKHVAYRLCAGTLALAMLATACDETDSASTDDAAAQSTSEGSGEAANGDAQSSTSEEFQALYDEVSGLQGEDALAFFESLPEQGVTGQDVIRFFIDLPISNANSQIAELFEEEAFERYMAGYPRGEPYEGFEWEKGMGTQISGPFSELDLKLPFTDYVPLPEGDVGDGEELNIGVTFHGFSHPWLINWADAAQWQADQHPNVDATVLDAEFDNNTMASHIDTFISRGVDGILVWPMVEAPTGPPVQRAEEAGIPVVSVDRLAGYEQITSRVTGNFPANGAQAGMALIHTLASEGDLSAKMVMLRKPLGSTADAVRTGHMLKVLSYFPEIEILQSYHDTDSREEAFANAEAALQAHPEIDVFFGTGDHQALAAWEAAQIADRVNSREGGEKIIFLSIDDSKEALSHVEEGNFEVNTPYTPLIADIGMRVLLRILAGEEMPQDIITPDIPMVTPEGEEIFGLDTQAPDEWSEYTFGPPL